MPDSMQDERDYYGDRWKNSVKLLMLKNCKFQFGLYIQFSLTVHLEKPKSEVQKTYKNISD